MKVVILAGGFGSRISEESQSKPKPMITIGQQPILWHIMKGFSHHGFNEFVICAGYKQDIIKEYFANFYLHASDITFDFTHGERTLEVKKTNVEPWKITIADTGYDTMTAGRVKRIQKFIEDEPFILTYGDGVSDINPNDIVAFHKDHGGIVTLTGVRDQQRFGVLEIDKEGYVNNFREKHEGDSAYINGGYMVCEPAIFDHIGSSGIDPDGEDFSGVTLENLARENKLTCYKYNGFWMCMDTQRDRAKLEELWDSGNAPWKVWE